MLFFQYAERGNYAAVDRLEQRQRVIACVAKGHRADRAHQLALLDRFPGWIKPPDHGQQLEPLLLVQRQRLQRSSHFVELAYRNQVLALGYGLRQRKQLQSIAHDSSEKSRPRTAQGPQQIAVLVGRGQHFFAIGGDDFGREYRVAGNTPFRHVPSQATTGQVASQPDDTGMRGRECQPMLACEFDEFLAANPRLDPGRAARTVDLDLPQTGQIYQQPVIAQYRARRIVPGRTDRDPETVVACITHRLDHVLLGCGAHDHARITPRLEQVPHHAGTPGLEIGITTADDFAADRIQASRQLSRPGQRRRQRQ